MLRMDQNAAAPEGKVALEHLWCTERVKMGARTSLSIQDQPVRGRTMVQQIQLVDLIKWDCSEKKILPKVHAYTPSI